MYSLSIICVCVSAVFISKYTANNMLQIVTQINGINRVIYADIVELRTNYHDHLNAVLMLDVTLISDKVLIVVTHQYIPKCIWIMLSTTH